MEIPRLTNYQYYLLLLVTSSLLLTCSLNSVATRALSTDSQVSRTKWLPNTESQNQTHTCPTWYQFHPSTQTCRCIPLHFISCHGRNRASLKFGLCTTYDRDTDLVSMVHCSFFRAVQGYNLTRPGYMLLPDNVSELNHYMCEPLHRRGAVCSECIDGYSPAVNSFMDECSNCKDNWYGIPAYLLLELVPLTFFYFFILIFQTNLTSGSMTCFIMYSQMMVIIFSIKFEATSIIPLMFTERNYLTLFIKILFTGYGVANLDFFKYIFPPFCIHNKLKSVHIAGLGYVSVFYPLLLILLTWAGIESYDRNFKPVILVCRPFRACLTQLQKKLNTKGDVINVFASFFLLAYTKVMYQSLILVMCKLMTSITYRFNSGESMIHKYVSYADLGVPCKSAEYFKFAIPALIITVIFNLIPVILIMLYPWRWFRNLLSRCKMDSNATKFFVERFQGCYKDSSNDGERDLRSFSALYFFLRMIVLLAVLIVKVFTSIELVWFPTGTVMLISALLMASCKPYKKTSMNVLDTLLLAHFGLLCYLMSVSSRFKQQYILHVRTVKVLFLLPLGIFAIWLVVRTVYRLTTHSSCLKNILKRFTTNEENYIEEEAATSPCQGEEYHRELLPSEAMTTKINVPTHSYGSTCTY